MNRRELLRVLGASAVLPALPGRSAERLGAAGRRVHARARSHGLQVLDPHQSETVATIAELIIPTTDTPGAQAAQVHRFIDLLLAEWVTDDQRAQFLKGLADVDARAKAAFGVDFLSATDAQRGTILTQLDSEAQAKPPPGGAEHDRQPPFFQAMKWLTVFGYCTSEVGATAELHYEVIPGSYDGCTDLRRASAGPGDF
jgi:uncharacterized membrane protein YccC